MNELFLCATTSFSKVGDDEIIFVHQPPPKKLLMNELFLYATTSFSKVGDDEIIFVRD